MVHFETSFPVRYYETDQMAIVHHSNYFRYFECARNMMMEEWGYSISKCEEDGVTIPIVKLECNFRFPARMGDIITVTAEIDKIPLAKVLVKQKVVNQRGQICAEGQATLGFLDKRTGRPVACPQRLIDIIKEKF